MNKTWLFWLDMQISQSTPLTSAVEGLSGLETSHHKQATDY